jgi:hypothetical protein
MASAFTVNRAYALLFALLVATMVALTCAAPALPTQDGPSHVYGLSIVADMSAGIGPWSEHFSFSPALSPNLGFLAVGAPLVRLFGSVSGALIAERVTVSLYVLLLAAGTAFTLRSFGRPALPLAYLALPLALNYPLFLGFYSYVLSAACFVASLGLLWRGRWRPLAWRAVLATALAVGVSLVHLIGGALVLLAAVVLELTRDRAPSGRSGWLLGVAERAVVVALPSAALAAAYVAAHPSESLAVLEARHSLLVLGWLLLTWGTVVLDPAQMVPAVVAFGAVVVCCPWRRFAAAHAERFLGTLALALVVLFFLLPNFLASGAYLNERLPWLVPLILLPVLRLPGSRRRPPTRPLGAGTALFSAVWLLLCLLPAARLAAGPIAPDLVVPGGSTLAVARFQPRPLWPLFDPMLHVGSRVALTSRAFDLAFYDFYLAHYPLRWHPSDWPAGTQVHDLYYDPMGAGQRALSTPDYVLALDAAPAHRAWLAARCRLVTAGGPADAPVWNASLWTACGP